MRPEFRLIRTVRRHFYKCVNFADTTQGIIFVSIQQAHSLRTKLEAFAEDGETDREKINLIMEYVINYIKNRSRKHWDSLYIIPRHLNEMCDRIKEILEITEEVPTEDIMVCSGWTEGALMSNGWFERWKQYDYLDKRGYNG